MELQRVLTAAAAAALPQGGRRPLPTSVAVITPYREQRSVLKATFEAMCGRGVTHPITGQVAIETVRLAECRGPGSALDAPVTLPP